MERSARLVFAELRVLTMRDSVSLVNAWDQFDDAGRLREPAAANQAMANMLANLNRWSQALRQVRLARAEPVLV